jgi:CheY-like chemotaxis protein
VSFWPLEQARVLVVSTEQYVRKGIAKMLSGSGYSCETATDGDHAFEQMAKRRPAIAVVDMRQFSEDDLFFVGLLRKRFPEIAVVRLMDGRAIIVSGKSEHVMELDDRAVPSSEMLHRAIQWILAERSLRSFTPRVGRA